ncbi:MAG: alpha/beta fold hydrolase [Phycisphaerales bacterium]|nr:alpha/beta fold hydrolase [Phycisphaerales bacterium]
MSHYVLVHGAWEGALSWENVVPTLEEQGHQVSVVELPGSLSNMKPIEDVTLETYISAVKEVIDKSNDQVILVGHSLGGIVISQVAERFVDRIERLIYAAAFLLKDGTSAIEAMQSDPGGQLLPQLVFSEDQSYAEVLESVWREVGFHDTQPEVINDVLTKLAAKQATEPFMAKLDLSSERFGSVPKYIIRTATDRIFSLDLQDRMIENWSVEKVVTLESGHFPALSMPKGLANSILSITASQRSTR